MPVAISQDICIGKLSILRVTEQYSMNMQYFNGAENQNAEYKHRLENLCDPFIYIELVKDIFWSKVHFLDLLNLLR